MPVAGLWAVDEPRSCAVVVCPRPISGVYDAEESAGFGQEREEAGSGGPKTLTARLYPPNGATNS